MAVTDDAGTAGLSNAAETPTAQRNIARDNHFVPQGLLRRWSDDGQTLYAYSLLVPDARVPEWEQKPIKSLAMRTNFYTVNRDGSDSDETEKWFAREFEQPGIEASQRLIDGKRLSRDDWHAVIRLYALQEVRTPQSFVEAMRRLDDSVPKVLQDTLEKTVPEIEQALRAGRKLEVDRSLSNAFSGHVKVAIEPPSDPKSDEAVLSATVTIGRAFWIATIQNALSGKAMEKLLKHAWHVLTPAAGFEWPLTDHPTLRLGYRSRTDFTFQAGWGRRNADLLMPLSPRHLLHVQVGKTQRGVLEADETITREIQHFLIRRAYRQIFAGHPEAWVLNSRPRIVDKVRFELEREQWAKWHAEQSVVEAKSSGVA